VSKERARRRAEREAVQSRVPAAARGGAKRRGRSPLRALPANKRRRPRADSILRARRRRQDVALLAVLLVLNALLWTQVPAWSLRATAAVLSLLAWPVLVILVFDRRPSS
jgi:hypothetical protein